MMAGPAVGVMFAGLGSCALNSGGGVEEPAGQGPSSEAAEVTSEPDSAGESGQAEEAATGRSAVRTVDLTGLFGLMEAGEVLLVDVRLAFRYQMGHIPGAINLSGRRVGDWVDAEQSRFEAALAAGKRIVVYCANRNCPDGEKVARQLAARGVPVTVFPGGWEEWKESGIDG